MHDDLTPRRCGLYLPGHEVHWIQGLRGGNDLETRRIPGRLIDVEVDGTIIIDVDGNITRVWNHEPDRLAWFAAEASNNVTLQPRWGALRVPSRDGNYIFYIADPNDHRECPLDSHAFRRRARATPISMRPHARVRPASGFA